MDIFDWSRLSPAHWFADATEPIDHPLYLVLAAVSAIGIVASVYVKLVADTLFSGHRFKQRQARRLANVVLTLAIAGLLILLFRWLMIPFLSKRIWFYLWWVATLASVGYVVYYWRRLYPRRLFEFHESERIRRYLPRSGLSAQRRRRPRRRT